MQNANTVVALTVHTAFVPSQRLRPRTTGSKKCTNLRRFRVDLDCFLTQHCPSTPASLPAPSTSMPWG